MDCGAEVKADSLMDSLTAGVSFDIPVIDLSGPLYQFPGSETGPLYAEVSKLSNDDLTTGEVAGSGTFDALMRGFKAHLEEEYNNDRITGAEYAKAYVELTQGAMQNATQFLLGREQAFWGAQKAQMEAIVARSNIEIQKIKAASAYLEANTLKASYAKMKISLAAEDIAYCAAEFNVSNILPKQEELLASQILKSEEDTALVTSQITGSDLNNSLFPTKLAMMEEQVEGERAKTLDTRTDGAPVAGSVGKQTELYSQQITSYQRDSEVKAGKLFVDAWITQKTIDEGLLAPDGFTNASLDDVLTTIKANNDLTPPSP